MNRPLALWVPTLLLPLLAGCPDTEKPEPINENEVITTVKLTFTPQSGAPALEVQWADPENDGSPVIDGITLSDAEDYDLSMSFLNELEDPPEDITVEVDEESDQHQVFFTGTSLGPTVSYTYGDTDINGFPVGLQGTVTTIAPGSGTFIVTLRHLPPENDIAAKTGTLAEDAVANGVASLPGDTDAEVTFELQVQ